MEPQVQSKGADGMGEEVEVGARIGRYRVIFRRGNGFWVQTSVWWPDVRLDIDLSPVHQHRKAIIAAVVVETGRRLRISCIMIRVKPVHLSLVFTEPDLGIRWMKSVDVETFFLRFEDGNHNRTCVYYGFLECIRKRGRRMPLRRQPPVHCHGESQSGYRSNRSRSHRLEKEKEKPTLSPRGY